jgi:tetratricopeptide (TPR) repeat protein
MRILLGQDGQNADAYLKTALTEFRAIGERWGISFALTELANLIAMRGEFTDACEYYEEAIVVVTEVGAVEDVVLMRSRQAQLYWLSGNLESSAAALAQALRYAERIAWPDALAELALARAELARWSGDREQAYQQLGIATDLLGVTAERDSFGAMKHDLLGYLADDLDEAREHRIAAIQAESRERNPSLTARVIVGVADLALRQENYERAAQLLAASNAVRGLADLSQPDVTRISQAVRLSLGDTSFTKATQEGAKANWHDLVEGTLAP